MITYSQTFLTCDPRKGPLAKSHPLTCGKCILFPQLPVKRRFWQPLGSPETGTVSPKELVGRPTSWGLLSMCCHGTAEKRFQLSSVFLCRILVLRAEVVEKNTVSSSPKSYLHKAHIAMYFCRPGAETHLQGSPQPGLTLIVPFISSRGKAPEEECMEETQIGSSLFYF